MSVLDLDAGASLGRPAATVMSLGRPGCAPERVIDSGWGRRRDKWANLDGDWSMRFWDVCDLLSGVVMKLVGGVSGVLLGVLHPAVSRAEDQRVTVTLHQTGSLGTPGVIVYAPGNRGHIDIDLATPGKGTI
jgi:hypothetical protein